RLPARYIVFTAIDATPTPETFELGFFKLQLFSYYDLSSQSYCFRLCSFVNKYAIFVISVRS
ncbi:MAG: hypothetical protein JSV76_00075, partial [Candidatus Bathyarchaeota archaeon]